MISKGNYFENPILHAHAENQQKLMKHFQEAFQSITYQISE